MKNASVDTRDTLTLREALYESNNQAAVKLQTQVGSRPVLRLAESVGLPRMPDVPSLALGVGEATPMQLTAAYAVFPNGGFAVTPRPIIQVLDNDGYAVFNREVERKPVISEAVAYQMVSMLADVVDVGTGAAARIARRALPRRRQDRHDRRFQGRVVRRLLVVARRGRVGGLRQAGDDRPRRLRRAIRAADLGRLHVAKRPGSASRRSSAFRRRSRACVSAVSATCCLAIRARPTRNTSSTAT